MQTPIANASRLTVVEFNTKQYAGKVQEKLQEAYSFQAPADRPTVEIEAGRKYFKVINNYGHQGSVHSFVDRTTGDVFKPDSWAKPAKGVRYNVVNGLDSLLGAVDPYGSYLYKR